MDFETYQYGVAPGYFTAAETRLLAGRDIRFTDTKTAPAVAVVNQQFARHLFNTEDAVGRYFKDQAGRKVQVVGVTREGKYFCLARNHRKLRSSPYCRGRARPTTLIVRFRPEESRAGAASMAATVRKLVHDLDPAIPLRVCGSWYSSFAFNLFPAQIAAVALSLFGAFGLMLSISGTFGLASYAASKRLRDLSIRVALGAQGKQILSVALGRLLIFIGVGAGLGVLLGAVSGRVLSAIVYQASAQDPFVLSGVAVTILLTGLLSVAGPARRVLRVDPATLLREL